MSPEKLWSVPYIAIPLGTDGEFMSTFLFGVLSSLAASFIYVLLTRTSLRWWRSYPRGVRFVDPDRDKYVHEIGELIRSNRECLFFKGFTGFDLFSSDIIKSAFDSTRPDDWKEMVFLLTEPESPAFDAEVNPSYSREHLNDLQRTVREYLERRLLPNVRVREGGLLGVYLVPERKNLIKSGSSAESVGGSNVAASEKPMV